MVDAIAGRIAAGLEGRRQAEVRVAALQATAEASATAEAPAMIKQLDPWENRLAKASTGTEQEYQRTLKFLQFSLESDYRSGFTTPPELAEYKGTKAYAEVVVDGDVVASVDNQGVLRTANDHRGLFNGKLAGEVNGRNGPNLAQLRAEQIAEMVGGKVQIADTAISQRDFEALPRPPSPEPILDHAGMAADPRSNLIEQLMQRRADYLDQR